MTSRAKVIKVKKPRKKTPINPLLIGGEPEDRLLFLISNFTSIRSEEQIEALRKYYVDGLPDDVIRLTVDSGNFTRANKRLIEAAINIEKIKEMDWCKLNHKGGTNA